MKRIIFFASLCLSHSLAAEPQPTDFGPNATLIEVDTAPLSPDQQTGLANFKEDASYFGAFYVSVTGEEWYYSYGYHSISAAKQLANRGCSLQDEPAVECRLHAVVLPAGADVADDTLAGFSQFASEDFSDDYAKAQEPGTFSAFAISGGGEYGWTAGWDTWEDALASAMAYCEADADSSLAGFSIATRRWAQEKGFNTCRVIDVQNP